MSRILNLPNRLTLGVGAFALLALAGGATTLAARSSLAAAPTDAACAADAADTTPETAGAPDTDTVDLQCGDQAGVDTAGTEGVETAASTKPDSDTQQSEVSDQTATDAAGTLN